MRSIKILKEKRIFREKKKHEAMRKIGFSKVNYSVLNSQGAFVPFNKEIFNIKFKNRVKKKREEAFPLLNTNAILFHWRNQQTNSSILQMVQRIHSVYTMQCMFESCVNCLNWKHPAIIYMSTINRNGPMLNSTITYKQQ